MKELRSKRESLQSVLSVSFSSNVFFLQGELPPEDLRDEGSRVFLLQQAPAQVLALFYPMKILQDAHHVCKAAGLGQGEAVVVLR